MGVANVVLNLIMIPRWGAAGAAAATAISAFGRAFWEYLALGRIHTFVLPGRVMISMFAASVAATLAVAWLPLTRWAFLFAATLGFSAVFLLLAWILKPFDAEDAPILKRAGYPVSELALFICRAS
jgi:O-antigen/teichoic acid export membrane protein